MKSTARCVTYFHARISKEARAILRLANITGKDFDQYLLESVVFTLKHNKRFIRPEVEEALTSYELMIKQEYEEKINEIHIIRELLNSNHNTPLSPSSAKDIVNLEFCPFCKRELRANKCSCEAWKIWRKKQEGDD